MTTAPADLKNSSVAPQVARGPRLNMRQREAIVAYILISPWIIGFVAFTAGPMLASLGLSFMETDMFTYKWVGLQNYQRLLSFDTTRSLFWKSLFNTAYYVFLSIPLTMATGFGIAMLLNQSIRGRSGYRIAYYLPAVIPGIAVSMLWLWLFNTEFGLINWFLSALGFEKVRWLQDPDVAKMALVIMGIWGAGANMLIFLAGLQSIPTQLYEAATIDGAGIWRRFRNITLPMISPTLFFVLITDMIWSFQVFTNAYVMTQGGPANSTLMYVLYLYNLAFKQFRFGFASALAWLYFIIIMAITVLVFKSSNAWVYYETEVGGQRS